MDVYSPQTRDQSQTKMTVLPKPNLENPRICWGVYRGVGTSKTAASLVVTHKG